MPDKFPVKGRRFLGIITRQKQTHKSHLAAVNIHVCYGPSPLAGVYSNIYILLGNR